LYSVIIPTYNSEKTIEKCIESVLKQTSLYLIDEIIVVDDGSNDNTDKVVEKIKNDQKDCDFIKLIKQDNKGASFARNVGINIAKGEWIALLDSDDIWKPNKLEVMTNIIKDNEDIVFLGSYYPLKILFKKYKGLKKLKPIDICIRNLPFASSVIYRKDKALELGLYNPKMKYGEDINFHQKFFKYDSYYVVGEDLFDNKINKDFIEQKGMSSNIYQMYKARNTNIKELWQLGYISKPIMVLMIIFSFLKHCRKLLICLIKKMKYRNGEYDG